MGTTDLEYACRSQQLQLLLKVEDMIRLVLDRAEIFRRILFLAKVRERWWERVLSGDKNAIDVRKIDCSRPMTDLDDESQTKIEQLMYDQRQKQLGLPTSEQQVSSFISSCQVHLFTFFLGYGNLDGLNSCEVQMLYAIRVFGSKITDRKNDSASHPFCI